MNAAKVIEFIISAVIIVRGVYYAYAYLNPNIDDMVLIDVIGYPFILLVIGMIMILPGVLTMAGNIADKMALKNVGLFIMSICFMFITTLHIIATTTSAEAVARPFSWIYPVALAIISGVVWLHNMALKRVADKVRSE